MLRSILKLAAFGLASAVLFQVGRSAFNWKADLNYSVSEQDIISDLPGAQMHLQTPAI